MITGRFQAGFAVASSQDRVPIGLEQFPNEELDAYIIFRK